MYRMISGGDSERIVYKQDRSDYYLYYYSNSLMHFNAWVLDKSQGGADFSVATEDNSFCVSSTSNWKVFKDGNWVNDDTVNIDCRYESTTEEPEPTADSTPTMYQGCCEMAMFYSSGTIKDMYPESLGYYTKISGDAEGRNLFKHVDSDHYLVFYTFSLMHYKAWVVSASINGDNFIIANEDITECVEAVTETWTAVSGEDVVVDDSAGIMCTLATPTISTDPTDSTATTDYTATTDPSASTATTDPSESTSTTDSTATTDPSDSTATTDPSDSTATTSSSTTNEPTLIPPISCCNLVQFASSGVIQQSFPQSIGVYKKQHYDTLGRTVYKKKNGDSYLYYINDLQYHYQAWVISDSLYSDMQPINNLDTSECVDTVSQPWTVLVTGDGDTMDWVEDGTATISCIESNCCQSFNVSSTGPVNEMYPDAMTVYTRSEEEFNDMPMYTSGEGYSVFYVTDVSHHTNGWTISREMNTIGEILNEGMMGCPTDGEGRWEYQNGQGWSSDNSLAFKCAGTECCRHLAVSSTGAVNQAVPEILGLYNYYEELEGRPVFRKSGNRNMILEFVLEYSEWVIRNQEQWIVTNQEQSDCPDTLQTLWEVFIQDAWIQDETFQIICS